MQNKEAKKKCQHETISPKYSNDISKLLYSYCYTCGILIIIEDGNQSYLYKPLSMEKKSEADPMILVNTMTNNNKDIIPSATPDCVSPWYISSRKTILGFLQKLSLGLKFSDATFYTALTYLDFLLKTKIFEVKGKSLEIMIIACFVLAAKFAENDIFEPELSQFESANGKYLFNANDLVEAEINVIKQLNYELIFHSVYDWCFLLLNNGFVFEDEIIGKPSDYINKIYASCKTSLAVITPSELLLDFDPFIIAFCLIEVTRNTFNLDSKRIEILKQLYKIDNDESYEDCFFEIQQMLTDSDGLKAPPVNKMALLAKDLNRKLTLNNPLSNPLSVISENKNKVKDNSNSNMKDNTNNISSNNNNINNNNNNHHNEDNISHPNQLRRRKVFKTVKEENRLDLQAKKNNTSASNRKNSFINKVEILCNEKGESINKLKLNNQPFCGSFSISSNAYEYYENNSAKNIKNNSTIDLPFPKEHSTMQIKTSGTYTKKRFTSDTKLPIIAPHK